MDIKEQCNKCIQSSRHWDSRKVNPSLRTSIQSFYGSHKDKTGFEMGCQRNCPFLRKSMKVLG